MVTHLGIQVMALGDITVYGLSYSLYNTDGYLGLPVSALGTDYIVMAFDVDSALNDSEFSIVGTQNGTSVTITPSTAADTRPASVPYTINLNQGDTYELGSTIVGSDLTGTQIQSNNPIAVFGNNSSANVPTSVYGSSNQTLEELWPTNDWGTNFVTIPLATRTGGDTFRFLASVNGTSVTVNGVAVATLNQGQFSQQNIGGPDWITANNPIYVAQYSNSRDYDYNNISDPFMITVPPTTAFGTTYLTSVLDPSFGFTPNYENIFVPTSAVGAVSLDGAAIPAGSFSPILGSGYSGAAVSVSAAEHVLTGPVPFGDLIYGFALADGYGYSAGSLASDIAATMTPSPVPIPTNTAPCTIQVWPDPFNPRTAFEGTLKADCLPTGAVVSFYTVSGELVNRVDEAGGMAQWDGTNRQDMPVSPGIYFYMIRNGPDFLGRGKFLIYR